VEALVVLVELELLPHILGVLLPQVAALRLGLVEIQVALERVVFMVQAAHLTTTAETSMAAAAARQALAEAVALVEPEPLTMGAAAALLLLVFKAQGQAVQV
jgi:hypothetical protein